MAIHSMTIDIMDGEYAMPGELEAWTPEHRRVEAWPDKAKRQIEQLEQRVLHLEALVHRLMNEGEADDGDQP